MKNITYYVLIIIVMGGEHKFFSLHTHIKKLIYGLVQLLRIVKGYQITDCVLIGFALPKLGIKRCAMEVKVKYNKKI